MAAAMMMGVPPMSFTDDTVSLAAATVFWFWMPASVIPKSVSASVMLTGMFSKSLKKNSFSIDLLS